MNKLNILDNIDAFIGVGFGIAFLMFGAYLMFYDKAFAKMSKGLKIMAIIFCFVIGLGAIYLGLPFLPK